MERIGLVEVVSDSELSDNENEILTEETEKEIMQANDTVNKANFKNFIAIFGIKFQLMNIRCSHDYYDQVDKICFDIIK